MIDSAQRGVHTFLMPGLNAHMSCYPLGTTMAIRFTFLMFDFEGGDNVHGSDTDSLPVAFAQA